MGIHFFYGQLHRWTEGPGRGEDTISFVTDVGGRGAPQKLTNPVSLPTVVGGGGGLGGGGMHEQPGFGWSLTQGRVRRMHRLVTISMETSFGGRETFEVRGEYPIGTFEVHAGDLSTDRAGSPIGIRSLNAGLPAKGRGNACRIPLSVATTEPGKDVARNS